jgi:hypothetical protein
MLSKLPFETKNIAFLRLEASLRSQQYAMNKFYVVRDSIEDYVATTQFMVELA